MRQGGTHTGDIYSFSRRNGSSTVRSARKNRQEVTTSLEVRKIYQVTPDSDAFKIGYLRIIDESGEDYLHYLYPAEHFIDAHLTNSVEAAVVNVA